MAANVERMFYVRETPWHGLGTKVQEAPTSKDALILAGLDWSVVQEPVYTGQNELVQGYKANVRDSDRKVLGVVTDRYKIVQNEEAFSFTDALLGEGVRYETAGSLQGGKSVWLLAHLPHEYIISGERISPYLLFSNTHDGSGAVSGYQKQLERRDELKELIDKMTKEVSLIEQEIKMMMGNAEKAKADNYRISWKASQRTDLDRKRIKAEEPEIYDRFKRTSISRRFIVSAA